MVAHAFWAVFCSSCQPSQIGPTAENDGAVVPSPIFLLVKTNSTEFLMEMQLTQQMTAEFL